MQILVHVLCTKGRSLREAIANDARIEQFGLAVGRERQPGRAPGWLKLHSSVSAPGALNVEWDRQTAVLNARVVTRGSAQASPIVGHLVNYLLARHPRRILSITTAFR